MTKHNPIVFDVNLHEFHQQVLIASQQKPILVDFWAEWCSPCIAIEPVLKRVVESFDHQVRLAKLEVDEGENMKLAGKYRVRGFPTIILFKDGEEQDRFSSAKPAHFIEEFIQAHL
ncbi:MAG: thioredoxin domain-containing protein [Gammaproteobacteria bacterium]|nr:thioredoxin domain-containing protein [Gammaproteobacteria bacterium]